jgi:hypothetical protein
LEGLSQPWLCGNLLAVKRISALVAVVLAIIWLPAVSCCLIDSSGIWGKQECCSSKESPCTPENCDQPCGVLASAPYFVPEGKIPVFAPDALPLFEIPELLTVSRASVCVGRDFPATAPPELVGNWQFSFRTALPPRPPSFVS